MDRWAFAAGARAMASSIMTPHAGEYRVCLRLDPAQISGVLTSNDGTSHGRAGGQSSFLDSSAASASRGVQPPARFSRIAGARTPRDFESHGVQPGLDGRRVRAFATLYARQH